MAPKYKARYISKNGRVYYQSVQKHTEEVSLVAKKDLRSVRLDAAAGVAGLIHDFGKYGNDFQQRINGTSSADAKTHSFQGSQLIMSLFKDMIGLDGKSRLAAEIISYAIACHHGLYDNVLPQDGYVSFATKVEKDDSAKELESLKKTLWRNRVSQKKLLSNIKAAVRQIKAASDKCYDTVVETGQNKRKNNDLCGELLFYYGLLTRLVLSAVIDGDWTSSAAFKNQKSWRKQNHTSVETWKKIRGTVENAMAAMPSPSAIGAERKRLADLCITAGEQGKSGVFELNLPTGAGKTFSSLRFALANAEASGKDRIIILSPLLQVLSQNAEEIKRVIGDKKYITEHHSNMVYESDKMNSADITWDTPIVLTTMVQFLNTLFSDRKACIRRFQSLTNSIIIIDEVQTVPTFMVSLFTLAVNFLARITNCTVVLCSATQPDFQVPYHAMVKAEQIVPASDVDWNIFRRTEFVDLTTMTATGFSVGDCVNYAKSRILPNVSSLLIGCNFKKQAKQLFHELEGDSSLRVFHLSASMCTEHRNKVVAEMKKALEETRNDGKKVVCVATQVMDAGVDISFEAGMRIVCGLDTLVQFSGRINRSREFGNAAKVYIVSMSGESFPDALRDIYAGQRASGKLFLQFKKTPKVFKNSLMSEESVKKYYAEYFDIYKDGKMDYQIAEGKDGDNENAVMVALRKEFGGKTSLYELLSLNGFMRKKCVENISEQFLAQSFSSAGKLFSVFGDDTEGVVVPYGKGAALISELRTNGTGMDAAQMKAWLNQAKRYMVPVYRKELEKLLAGGFVATINEVTVVVNNGMYDKNVGLLKVDDVQQV